MSFGSPSAFAWLLLAIPIVVFYVLKVRMRRVPVSTTMFWKQVHEEKSTRSLWQQLRHLLSLLIQLLLLLLLVFALADPFFADDERNQRRLVVVLDTSASMQSVDAEGDVPFADAVEKVAGMIDSLSNQDEMSLVTVGNGVDVVCGLTSHQRTLRDRLANVRVSDAPGKLLEGIELAQLIAAGREKSDVVVVSDGRVAKTPAVEDSDGVTWMLVGEDAANVGITRLQVRRSLNDALTFEALIEVRNFSEKTRRCKLDLLLNDAPLDVYPLDLQPGEVWRKVIAQRSETGGILSAELRFDEDDEARDGLVVDNRARAILPDRQRVPVTLVTEGNWFLQRVLDANDSIRLNVVEPDADRADATEVTVFHRSVPQKLPGGSCFVVQPENSTDLWDVVGNVEESLVGEQQSDHNLMKNVSLDNVLMPEARRIVPTSDAEVLVKSISGDPLLLRFVRDAGDVVVLTVNLEQGDLPLRTAFPILLINAMNSFSDGRGELIEALPTGVAQQLEVPANLSKQIGDTNGLVAKSEDGTTVRVPVSDGVATVGPLPVSGLWRLKVERSGNASVAESDVGEMTIACNLVSSEEGRLVRSVEESATARLAQSTHSAYPLWFYLVSLVVVLFFLEWLLFQRRVIG